MSPAFHGSGQNTVNASGALACARLEIKKHPYQMVLLTFSLGYLLGGGLFSRATYRMAGALMAACKVPYIRMRLLSYLEGTLGQMVDVPAQAEAYSDSTASQQKS